MDLPGMTMYISGFGSCSHQKNEIASEETIGVTNSRKLAVLACDEGRTKAMCMRHAHTQSEYHRRNNKNTQNTHTTHTKTYFSSTVTSKYSFFSFVSFQWRLIHPWCTRFRSKIYLGALCSKKSSLHVILPLRLVALYHNIEYLFGSIVRH